MKKIFSLVFFVGYFLLTSTSLYAYTLEQGKAFLMPFKKELMGTLMKNMKEGGPVKALKTCHLKAMPITEKYGKKVVGMGRTSHRLRNPKNAPQEWVRPYLEEFKKSSSQKKKSPLVVKLKNGHFGYLEPIYIQGKCLICHGEKMVPSVKKALGQYYPKDRAKGFKEGDFRGLFWLEVAKD